MLLGFEYLLSYTGLEILILLSYFSFAFINNIIINKKLDKNLNITQIEEIITPIILIIISSFDLILKNNKGLQRMYHLFYPTSSRINNYIANKILSVFSKSLK